MTDNQTTELRDRLTERGIEYAANDHMGVFETSWNGFTAMQLTPSAKLIMVVTPEQAIAATLGSDTKGCESLLWELVGALDVADATDASKKPIVTEYARRIAATLGSTLTAEQVRKAIEEAKAELLESCEYVGDMGQRKGDVLKAFGKMEQAIADELSAELGSGTCEWILEHSGTLYDKWRCSKCGYLHVESRIDGGATDLDPNYCPNCGARIRKAVER